jgi:hypothetical protein
MISLTGKLLFLSLILIFLCSVFAQQYDKIDVELQEILEKSDPSKIINIIIVFKDKPNEDQLNILRINHKMEITHVYKIINGVAGKMQAGEIIKIANYDWVKEIWLDKKVYATSDKTMETSKLIETLQRENDELNNTISILNRDINKLQEQISQLSINLKIYPTITFIIGLIIGVIIIIFIKR